MPIAVQCSFTFPIRHWKSAMPFPIVEGQAKQTEWRDILIDGYSILACSAVFHAAIFLSFAVHTTRFLKSLQVQ